VARDWAEGVRKGLEKDAETWERVRGEVVRRAEGVVVDGDRETGEGEGERKRRRRNLGDVKLERQADVEGKFKEAVEWLGRLKRDMPATVAKMERARVAGGYVVEGK
jgi:kinetochor protein Mis14/NSL1